MSGGIEVAGDIATGALLGRAVEPRTGEHGSDATHGVCLNCGTALIGDYCHACGQNGHVHKTLGSIGHDLLHGVFHFEGKVWRTLPMLIMHPGKLTRRYIDGERARFVSPLALFLFFVFLMFATVTSLGHVGDVDFDTTPQTREERLASIDGQIAKTQAELTKAEAVAAKGGPDAEDVSGDIVGMKATLQGLQVGRTAIVGSKDDGSSSRSRFANAKTGWPRLDHGIAKANANPELALYKLRTSAYKYSWALIPISIPFVALLFLWRRQYRLYDHAIFVTYSLSFMLLLVTVITLLAIAGAPGWAYGSLIAFGPPVHMFAQLRGTYALRGFSALWRTVALLMFGNITLTLFILLLLGLGLMD